MIKIVGDINFSDGYFDTGIGIGTAVAKGADPFAHLQRSEDDFWIGNFECVVTDGTKEYPFVIKQSSISHIKHLDLYDVANNHVMQFGDDSYKSLLSFIDAQGIMYVGAETRKSVITNHQGKRVGIIAFSQRPDNFTDNPKYWSLPEYKSIAETLEDLECDYKIVFIHWGYEFINYPNIDQKHLAHYIVDCGADLIVGMHPHVMQGVEMYKSKPIYYSLGNCVFNMPWEPTKYGLLVSVDLSGDKPIVNSEYLRIGEDFFPKPVKNVPEQYSLPLLNKLIAIKQENEIYFSKTKSAYHNYRKANRKWVVGNLVKISFSAKKRIIQDFINRKLKNHK